MALKKRIDSLERILETNTETPESLSQILKRLNAIQSLVDQIEIEIDKLEMRVSAIEHMGFRLKTGG